MLTDVRRLAGVGAADGQATAMERRPVWAQL